MSNPENQLNRAAIGIELLTAWADQNSTALVQNSLLQILADEGGPGLVNATMGLLDVAALLLMMQRESTGDSLHTILRGLARKVQRPAE